MVAEGKECVIQKNYWIEHSADLSVEAMMLDSKAMDLDKEDRPQLFFEDSEQLLNNLATAL